jgi:hypothetical protein
MRRTRRVAVGANAARQRVVLNDQSALLGTLRSLEELRAAEGKENDSQNENLVASEGVDLVDVTSLRPLKEGRGKPLGPTPPPKGSGTNQCVVCWDKKRNTMNIGCGHLCLCEDCADRLDDCPICRAPMTQLTRVYF